jgi:hypothetical protein
MGLEEASIVLGKRNAMCTKQAIIESRDNAIGSLPEMARVMQWPGRSGKLRKFFLSGGLADALDGGMDELTRDHGTQPLDGLLDRWNLTNHELVEVSEEQLNHKQVQKARKGRQLTLHLMQKLTRALNETIVAKLDKERVAAFVPYLHKQLFNYAKGYDADRADPNEELMPR